MTRYFYALASIVFALASNAAAQEFRFLGGVDFFAVNNDCSPSPGSTPPPSCDSKALAEAELGIGVRADLRGLAHDHLDLRLDYRDREVLVGDSPSRHELHDLSLTARNLGGRLDLVVGRFPVPGGFWLITDGGAARLRLGPVSIMGYGGLRSFTGGREDATFAGVLLPLAGGAVTVEHPVVRGSLGFTWTQDRLTFYRGGQSEQQATSPDPTELFIDGQLLVLPHPTLFIAGGLTFGTRYELTYLSGSLANFTAPPTVDEKPLQSFMAYAVVEWRPVKRLRLSYAFDFDRVRIAVVKQPLDNSLTAAGGSFEDHTLKASWRVWRALRLEARYRLRFRENTDIIHRFEGGALGDDLLYGIGAFVTVGGDVYQFDRASSPGNRNVIVYTGGVSFVRPWLDVRGGILYTDAIGSGVAFSTHAQQMMGAGPTTELFPLVMEGQRIAFLRAFVTTHGVFAGVDGELNMDANQVRLLAQVGWAR